MRASKAAAAAAEWTEDKEIDLLLGETPHVTSPQGRQRGVGVIGDGNGVHRASGSDGYASPMRLGCRRVHCPPSADGYDAQHAMYPYYDMALNRRDNAAPHHGDAQHGKYPYYDMILNRRDNAAPHHGGGDAGGMGFPTLSSVSGPLVGSVVPPPPPPSPLPLGADDPEQQLIANQLRSLRIGDAQGALLRQGPASVMSAAQTEVPAAHGAYHGYGYTFTASGSSFPYDRVFLDQAKAVGHVAARPHRFVSDAGLDDFGGFPRALDTSIRGFMYNKAEHGPGIGWGQGLVQSDFPESCSYLLPSQPCAEFPSSSPVALKRQYVPMADNGFARGRNSYENSLIFNKKNMNSLERERERRFQRVSSRTLRFDNLVPVKGSIYHMAKDKNGCRYLQDKLLEGKHHVDVIFEGIINHIAELMVSSFGNYLVQKMLEVGMCDEDQRLRIILVLTQDPVKQLITISLNTHGTRVVQRLIQTVRSREQIILIISALQPSFMLLVKDHNGYRVIENCLENFGAEDNKFIFEGAAANCLNMAVHCHGCCVLQSVIKARGRYLANLIMEICPRGFELAQHPFGNYVVQCVLEQQIPSANAHLASLFEGKYVYLSKQQESSNVVEKCLMFFQDDAKAVIIQELLMLSCSDFEQLLQDPFANYVFRTALDHTRGRLHNVLVEAILPHENAIRNSPHCKRICRHLPRR